MNEQWSDGNFSKGRWAPRASWLVAACDLPCLSAEALALVAPANLVVMPNKEADLYRLIGDRLPQSMRAEYAAYVERMFDFRGLFREDERSLGKMFLDFQRFYGVAATASAGGTPPSASAGSACFGSIAGSVVADLNGNEAYDPPPADHAWRLDASADGAGLATVVAVPPRSRLMPRTDSD